jgi:hypothetical protein
MSYHQHSRIGYLESNMPCLLLMTRMAFLPNVCKYSSSQYHESYPIDDLRTIVASQQD